ncbi:MAG: preprotein translocase subunit SecE [Candidatus Aramenus sulfurataquae]|jgi:protein translocase SEC61 complex gamma subunit|uniref:Protein translocase subunit SecE n=2 Tax=Candidatus Aramenus sulfurataquae TaxID=1326980 RepID=W7L7U3_9CREN|nr:MAG: preprotein translocase subunit SecE [Candidatus Aramenus sulfurataquae]MBW9140979.1 protein translocase SEC61 complex subunit gamma [Candidatus Aramenus sp.]MCL7343506.1 protein translocase SEC61 complex subunit gamma [Candidatus Aramenus sulfurataquae]
MDIIEEIKKLPEEWRKIISVSKKPDRDLFMLNLKVTLAVMVFVGVLAFLIQLAVTYLIG